MKHILIDYPEAPGIFITGKLKSLVILIVFIILLFGQGGLANAQDIIKLKSGNEIKATVIEENPSIVKYREYGDPSGPVYSIGMEKVESISYKRGTKPVQEAGSAKQEEVKSRDKQAPVVKGQPGELIFINRNIYLDGIRKGPKEIRIMMEDMPEALNAFEKGRKMLGASASCAFGVIMVSSISSFISIKQKDDKDKVRTSAIGLAIDGGIIIAAIVLGSGGRNNLRKSVSLYNSAARKPVSMNISIGVQEHGIGFGVRF